MRKNELTDQELLDKYVPSLSKVKEELNTLRSKSPKDFRRVHSILITKAKGALRND
jgi:hypothetical protein